MKCIGVGQGIAAGVIWPSSPENMWQAKAKQRCYQKFDLLVEMSYRLRYCVGRILENTFMDDDFDQYVQDPTELQIKTAFMGPALAVNRCIATLGPTGLRIAFLEEDTEASPNFRAAVTMSPQDGIGLYKMLQSVLLDIDSDQAATADLLRQWGQGDKG